jgi:ABC-type nickel/cobalt efflux system permease component RcnA
MHEWITILEATLSNNFTFSVIFILGMFHALEPGHGKTLIIAYMTGGSMRFYGAAQLISGLILVHFLLFSLLAFFTKSRK